MKKIFKEFVESGKDYGFEKFTYSFNGGKKMSYDVFMQNTGYYFRFNFTQKGMTIVRLDLYKSNLGVSDYTGKDEILKNIVLSQLGNENAFGSGISVVRLDGLNVPMFDDSDKKLYKQGLGKAMELYLFVDGTEKEYFSKAERYDIKFVDAEIDVTDNGSKYIYLINDKVLTNNEDKLLYDSVTTLEKRKVVKAVVCNSEILNMKRFDEKLAKSFLSAKKKNENLTASNFFMSKVKIY
jgi:hypothetical protein